eukprot:c18539_g1_i3.p1 GENE.c18539_g1_i3~~c18539_g1_i3.p1  ORF type:complete len:185 (+),score=24.56 c18539_g1_i3:104-658(+)
MMRATKSPNRSKVVMSVVNTVPSLIATKNIESVRPRSRTCKPSNYLQLEIEPIRRLLDSGATTVNSVVDAYGVRWEVGDKICVLSTSQVPSGKTFFKIVGVIHSFSTTDTVVLRQMLVDVCMTRDVPKFIERVTETESFGPTTLTMSLANDPKIHFCGVATFKTDSGEDLLIPFCGLLPYTKPE